MLPLKRTKAFSCHHDWWLFFVLAAFAGCGPNQDTDSASRSSKPVEISKADVLDKPRYSFGDDEKRRVALLLKSHEFQQASELLQTALLANPHDVEALFSLARAQAGLGKLDEAISLLSSIPNDHPQAGLAALGQAADWCLQRERFSEAESRYLRIVELAPHAALARRQLVLLYNRQGRRQEAAKQIQGLCRIGDVREDELRSLISVSDAIFDAPDDLPIDRPPVLPIGAAGQARKRFSERNYAQAAELLAPSVALGNASPAVSALYGRCLAESQQQSAFLDWFKACSDETKEFAEYWSALGAHLIGQHRYEEAARALAEGLRRDPTDRQSIGRMIQTLLALGKEAEAKRWRLRSELAYKALILSNRIALGTSKDPEDYDQLSQKLVQLGRPLEAIVWKMIAANRGHRDEGDIEMLNRQRLKWVRSKDAFGTEAERLCGLDYTSFPLPSFLESSEASLPTSPRMSYSDSIPDAKFQNIATTIGLDHQFNVASKGQENGFAIYQQYGGGVAVLDFDLDGLPDLYFAQGGSDPPDFVGDQSNTLYRNVGGELANVTIPSQSVEFRYSIGVTAGDQNQDGFCDLFVTNLGMNTMFINNGDGTFQATSMNETNDTTIMSTSMALADVTGDALPDLVELCFAHDKTIVDKPTVENGVVIDVRAPLDFRPASDRLLVNDGKGGWIDQNFDTSEDMRSTGLGVVVSNFDSTPGNEVFVGNDTRFDHLWKRIGGRWTNMSHTMGCAFAHDGSAIASMGIATADFDGSGTVDLFVTNFQDEPNALFLNSGQSFRDRAISGNLATSSVPFLGFGTQAVDFNLDGMPDLMVTNGHIDNFGTADRPFKQQPQMFGNRGGGVFEAMEVIDPSHYFKSAHVGRALVRLDFNLDGKADAVITHLGSPSALLVNQYQTNHHWLDIQLVGTTSERDAIGTKVTVHAGANEWSQWSTAGDGYLCRNEPLLSFGFGSVNVIDKVIVEWPNGQAQVFRSVPTDKKIMVIQGQDEIWIP